MVILNFVTNGILFMYDKNNIGPKLEPCVTPQVISCKFEFHYVFLYIVDDCLSSLQIDLMQYL